MKLLIKDLKKFLKACFYIIFWPVFFGRYVFQDEDFADTIGGVVMVLAFLSWIESIFLLSYVTQKYYPSYYNSYYTTIITLFIINQCVQFYLGTLIGRKNKKTSAVTIKPNIIEINACPNIWTPVETSQPSVQKPLPKIWDSAITR